MQGKTNQQASRVPRKNNKQASITKSADPTPVSEGYSSDDLIVLVATRAKVCRCGMTGCPGYEVDFTADKQSVIVQNKQVADVTLPVLTLPKCRTRPSRTKPKIEHIPLIQMGKRPRVEPEQTRQTKRGRDLPFDL